MGFAIFESSGIFNPKDYGLTVGDLLHLIVVGGGGGGSGTSNGYSSGAAGGASSFGSILTAEGGLSPSNNNAVTPQAGSYRGAFGVIGSFGRYTNSGETSPVNSESVFGGGGADGWAPGICKGRSGFPSTIFANINLFDTDHAIASSGVTQDNYGHTVNLAFGDGLVSAIPASNQLAGSGGIYIERGTAICVGGAGGIGYGAGGGGGSTTYPGGGSGRAGAGGNSGVISQKSHLLTSMDAVPITVGVGGKGGTGYAGGDGANGCVAIFW